MITSPGKNGATKANEAKSGLSIIMDRPITPGIYSAIIPPSRAARALAGPMENRAKCCMLHPVTKAAIGNPIRNPTLGEANTAKPPRPPAKRGKPSAVKPRNNDDLQGFTPALDSAKYAADTSTISVPSFKALGVSFYPNPTSNVITIKTASNAIGQVAVKGLDGRILFTEQVSGTATVNVATLNSGIYLLEFTNDSGQRASAKFVKL